MAEYVWERKNRFGHRVVVRSSNPVMFIDGDVWMPVDGVIRRAGQLGGWVRAADGSTYYDLFVFPTKNP